MSEQIAEAQAYMHFATAVVSPIRKRLGQFGNGFMTEADAAWFREALAEIGRLRAQGERIAAGLGCSEFAEWVGELHSAETTLRGVEASMKPIRMQ